MFNAVTRLPGEKKPTKQIGHDADVHCPVHLINAILTSGIKGVKSDRRRLL